MNPAIGLLEFDSVAAGIHAADAMAKRAPIGDLVTGTVQPGRYLVLVAGEVASVEESMDAGRGAAGGTIIGDIVLSDIHPDVVAALRGDRIPGPVEALGVVETLSVAPLLGAADAGLKGAAVELLELNIADGLGGKAYLLFGGEVSDVEAAVSIATDRVAEEDLVGGVVIPQLHEELGDNLSDHGRFGVRLGREDDSATR